MQSRTRNHNGVLKTKCEEQASCNSSLHLAHRNWSLFRQGCHHQAPGTTAGTTNSEGLDFEVGLSTAFAVAAPNGTSLRLGEHMPPARGNQQKKRGGRELHAPQDLLPRRQCKYFPAIIQTVQTVYKPSYKPCTAPREFVQTVQTVTSWGVGE